MSRDMTSKSSVGRCIFTFCCSFAALFAEQAQAQPPKTPLAGMGIMVGEVTLTSYHSVDPSGMEEFSSGALVDANSRLGRKPGDPESTDPEGLSKQPYYQDPRSGGFLHIAVAPGAEGQPATLTFKFRDEHGVLLHKHTKQR